MLEAFEMKGGVDKIGRACFSTMMAESKEDGMGKREEARGKEEAERGIRV